MDPLHPFQCCLPGLFATFLRGSSSTQIRDPDFITPALDEKSQRMANDLLDLLQRAQTAAEFRKMFKEEMNVKSWTENIAVAILHSIEELVRSASIAGGALKEALDRATEEAANFIHDHPYFCTLIALGMLVVLCPWVLEVLGFGELGPIEGTFAALWQSTYRGFVPKRSLFSFFQRLGMVWK